MKRPSHLTLVIIAGAILLASLIVFRRHLPYTGISLARKSPPPVVVAMENAYLVGLGHNGKLWSVRAGSVEMARDRFIVTVNDPHDGKVFDKGKVALRMRAGKAAYSLYARNLQLSGGVFIEGDRGQKISAPGADWNSFAGMLRSTGRVTFESPAGRMSADMLTVDVRRREMSMWNVAGTANASGIDELAGEVRPSAN